ncbi:MAG: lipolytic protein G-D-S-L family [Gallionellaceae bacterium]|nr:MAG: lipolytic protein G-D-S-L family [Gallionellaceae bacterium]
MPFLHPLRFDAVSLWRSCLLVAALALLTACGNKPKDEPLPPGSQVLALGDSLTAGYGVAPDEAWPSLLAGKTGWTVINGGINGNTSSDALARLPSLLEEHKPVLVFITLGGNDMLRHIPAQETITNLEKMIALVRVRGAKPIILATPKPSIAGAVFQNLSAAEFYRDVAKAQQVPLIEDAIADVLSDPRLKVDQLHPNAAGHQLLTEKILDELRKIGLVR